MKNIAVTKKQHASLYVTLFVTLFALTAQAAPFGMTSNEPTLNPAYFGPFAPFVSWLIAQQSALYALFASSLRAIKTDPAAALPFMGLCFAYGALHAASAGHGKAIISSYILASNETLRRGIVISLVSALVQGGVAIALVGIMALVFQASSLTMMRASAWLEGASYALIALMGVWLIVRAFSALGLRWFDRAGVHQGACCNTEQSLTTAADFNIKALITAIIAVGLRPCSGAIIVLVFALLQGMFWVGIWGVVAMSLGTGLTVAALASLAVGAKELALKLAGRRPKVFVWLNAFIQLSIGLLLLLMGSSFLLYTLS